MDQSFLDSLLVTDIAINKTLPLVALTGKDVFRWLFRKDTVRLTKRETALRLSESREASFYASLYH